ncbi:hypothetical protein [Lactobacillus panisapium]|nr:hypothetical protein [Lactobacillus panisapium]
MKPFAADMAKASQSGGRVLKEIDPKVVSANYGKEGYAPFDLSQLQ